MAPPLSKKIMNSLFGKFDSSKTLSDLPFDQPKLIRPNIDRKVFNVSHYGVMIPNLPEPFKYFSIMAIIGTAGNRLLDTDHMLVDKPSRNVTQVSGTAAEGTGQFKAYSIDRHCNIQNDGSLIQFGDDIKFTGLYPDIRLQVNRQGFELDIQLHCLDKVTWFMHSSPYKHLGLMADYAGHITYKGQRHEISGPCTYEYFTMAGPYGFINKPLPEKFKLPMDFFSYQIVHIDADTQMMFAKVGVAGKTVMQAAFIRGRDECSKAYTKSTKFKVTQYEDNERVAPDGRMMRLPKKFTWTVNDGKDVIAIINGTVDTPFTYGLCSGYVGGYAYEGELKGKPVSGRAYIEYVDAR